MNPVPNPVPIQTVIGGIAYVMFNTKIDGVEVNYILSNDCDSTFMYNDIPMVNAEQACAYAMYYNRGCLIACEDIMTMQTGAQVRAYLSRCRLLDPADWKLASLGIITEVLAHKFYHHQISRNFLLATGECHIVNISYCDDDHGCTVDENDGSICGGNKIGEILMTIREGLVQDELLRNIHAVG